MEYKDFENYHSDTIKSININTKKLRDTDFQSEYDKLYKVIVKECSKIAIWFANKKSVKVISKTENTLKLTIHKAYDKDKFWFDKMLIIGLKKWKFKVTTSVFTYEIGTSSMKSYIKNFVDCIK